MRGPGHKRNTRVCIGPSVGATRSRPEGAPVPGPPLHSLGRREARAAVHGRTMTRLGVRVLCGVLCGLPAILIKVRCAGE